MSNIVELKISQDAVRKYAEEVRELEKEIKVKDTIIKNLKKVVIDWRKVARMRDKFVSIKGEIDREEKDECV